MSTCFLFPLGENIACLLVCVRLKCLHVSATGPRWLMHFVLWISAPQRSPIQEWRISIDPASSLHPSLLKYHPDPAWPMDMTHRLSPGQSIWMRFGVKRNVPVLSPEHYLLHKHKASSLYKMPAKPLQQLMAAVDISWTVLALWLAGPAKKKMKILRGGKGLGWAG